MRTSFVICALVLSITLCISLVVADKGFIPIHWSDLPKAQPDDVIEIYQLVAPLFKVRFGDFFAKLNLFHMGVGFHNHRTGEEWTVDYNALPTFEDSVFPAVKRVGKEDKLMWQNYGGALMYGKIARDYWSVEPNKVVGRMTGENHNNFILNFLPKFNETRPFYVPLDVYSKWNSKQPEKRKNLVKGYTCSEFVWEAFDALRDHGAQFNCAAQPRKNTMLFHAKSVKTVELEDPQHKSKIVNFYKAVVHKFKNMSIGDAMKTIWSLFIKGNAYLRHGTTYIHVNLKLPYLSWHYHYEPMPGCERVAALEDDYTYSFDEWEQ